MATTNDVCHSIGRWPPLCLQESMAGVRALGRIGAPNDEDVPLVKEGSLYSAWVTEYPWWGRAVVK